MKITCFNYFSLASRTLFFTALLMIAGLSGANANQTQTSKWLSQATDIVKKQEILLNDVNSDEIGIDTLSTLLKEILPIKSDAQNCIGDTKVQLQKVTDDLATLGKVTAKETEEVAQKRFSITNLQKYLRTDISSCKLLLLQSQDLINTINELQQGNLAQQLSARTPHIVSVLMDNLKAPVAGWQDSVDFLRAQYQLKLLSVQELSLLVVLVVIGVAAGFHFANRLRETAAQADTPTDSVSAYTLAVRTSLAPALPMLIAVAISAAFLSIALPLNPLPFVTKASYAVGIYLGLIVWINILLNPAPPAEVYLTKPAKLSRRFARRLKVLLTLSLVGIFLLTGEFKASLSEPVYYLGRSIFSVLFIINLVAILWLLRLFSWAILSRGPRIFLSLLFIASLIADLLGYRNLSFFVLGGIIGMAIGLGLTMLIYQLLKDLCDGLDEGRLKWEEKLRTRIGLKPGEQVPGMVWVRIIIFACLWGGFVLVTLHIWKLDDPWVSIISAYLTEGFHIGSLNVTPYLLFGGILSFALIISITRFIKKRVLPHGLKYTRLDKGAREAVTSLFGYAGVAIAILLALSITGVQMQNIAIIAGALSVGIGFGLQNIVNNFISGLILLFERPIRRGDWIVTGDTEGYVKAINIRSTQIQTFDRADVIVPNSELITAKVTNWMLRDPYGRIIIPVGVGYDSDVEKVHKVLMRIAKEHPNVMLSHPMLSGPKVLFINFGDSSLNFELRCFIHDIDQRMNVISEINYAIVKAFRKEGIEIPFPQRVVTMMTAAEKEKTDSHGIQSKSKHKDDD